MARIVLIFKLSKSKFSQRFTAMFDFIGKAGVCLTVPFKRNT